MAIEDEKLVRMIAAAAMPLTGGRDLDGILRDVGETRFVLIGEASHGSQEFYRLRAQLTRRLIREHGFHAVAIEGDWPDAHRVDRYVRGRGEDRTGVDALSGFRRFPAWMWRNAEVLEFVGWLRSHNDDRPAPHRVGFYGLDLYCLQDSMAAVLAYLDRVDPEAARRARERYACFDHVDADLALDPRAYGFGTHFGLRADCADEVIDQMVELGRRRAARAADEVHGEEDAFDAEQNARAVKDAERYYRTMFSQRVSSWNVRDRHMAETLDAVAGYLTDRIQAPARVVVWAHNSHVGDARATDMGLGGELTLGQLARERHPGQVMLIGFTTYNGTVTAASDWDAPVERKRVRDALPGSYEDLFHRTGLAGFALPLGERAARTSDPVQAELAAPRLHRAIGVIYRPDTERRSHYLHGRLAEQFDTVIHVDRTHALEPLERTVKWHRGEAVEVPETYPTGV